MATKQESSVSLKLLIDEKTNRVVAAEAEKDFVDMLFSFLTFPMGTIIRVTSREQVKIPVTIGCMNNLYRSIQNSPVNWHTQLCKTMVLNPRNPCAFYCNKLKMNIDDSGSEMKYVCSRQGCWYFSKYQNVSCWCSSGGTTKEMKSDYSWSSVMNCRYVGAFLQRGSIMFLISDDLQIRPASPHFLAQLLSGFGLSETSRIREMPVEVSKEQVTRLLARSLVSKSPLSDVFLQGAKNTHAKLERALSSSNGGFQAIDYKSASVLYLKVKVNKNTNKILYAEATDEFFDFLCSLLTVSIGSVVRALQGNSGLECIDNLYTSVKDLDEKWFGSGVKAIILDPWIAQHHNCKKQPLNFQDRIEDGYMIDPRNGNNNFAEEPSLFIVTDDLEVNPLSFASSFQVMREVKVPFSDIEEQVITVGFKEALSLLKAALTSPSSALNNGLSTFLKKQKA
nr:uncharacterized protein LOC109182299 [Ipomoea batatas]